MKKLLLVLSLIVVSNSFATWVHLANDTDARIRVTAKYVARKSGQSYEEDIKNLEKVFLEPYSVQFIETNNKPAKIVALSLSGSSKNTANNILTKTDMSYFAFHFKPTTTSWGKPSYSIKQRTQDDAKLLIIERKVPTNPQYVN